MCSIKSTFWFTLGAIKFGVKENIRENGVWTKNRPPMKINLMS
jgi:hypothetical protein